MTDIYRKHELPNLDYPNSTFLKYQWRAAISLGLITALGVFWNAAFFFGLFETLLANATQRAGWLSVISGRQGLVNSLRVIAIFLVSAVFVWAALRFAWRTIQFVAQSFTSYITTVYSRSNLANIPKPFVSRSNIVEAMREHKVPIHGDFSIPVTISFGENLRYATPVIAGIVEARIKGLSNLPMQYGRLAVKLSIMLAVLIGILELSSQYGLGIAEWLQPLVPFDAWVTTLIWSLLAIAAVAGLRFFADYLFISKACPEGVPTVEASNVHTNGKTVLTPTELARRVELEMKQFQYEGHPNRLIVSGESHASVSVSDTGEFTHDLMIERQPLPIEQPKKKAVEFLLAVSWGKLALALVIVWFLVLPYPVSTSIKQFSLASPLTLLTPLFPVVLVLLANQLWRSGIAGVEDARIGMNSIWFAAPIAYVHFEGSVGKRMKRIGNMTDDSIATESQTTLTQFTAEVWSSEAIAEVASPTHGRHLIAMRINEDSENWQASLLEAIAKSCEQDVMSKEDRDTMHSNAEMLYFREKAKKAGALEAEEAFKSRDRLSENKTQRLQRPENDADSE